MSIQSYLDPIVNMYNKDEEGNPIALLINNEQHEIVDSKIVLNQIPEYFYKVRITSMSEIPYDEIVNAPNLFKVDYSMGIVYFDNTLNGDLITINSYKGVKVYYFPASRVWTVLGADGKTVEQTFQEMVDSMSSYVYKGNYIGATTYAINEQVIYLGSTYIATSITTGNLPTDTNYWRLFAGGENFKGDYVAGTQYYARDVVQYSNAIYQCILKPTVGTLPTNTTYWIVMLSFSTLISNMTTAESARGVAEGIRITSETTRATNETSRGNAEGLRVTAENTRVTQNTTRGTAETARATAETVRVGAETDRVTAEGLRVTADGTRTTNETARGTAETARVTAENTRVTQNTARGTAETARVGAETARVTEEGLRVTAESTRVTQNTARGTAEGLRVTAESSRVSAETPRVTAETSRINAETTRGTNETTRGTNETARVTAESTRVTQNTDRTTAETARVTAESSRVTVESARVTAESARVTQNTDNLSTLSAHINNFANPHSVTKTQVGLDSADNTSDVNKPISTATQTSLNLKANLASPTFTGNISGISKTMVGLPNIDNTSDINKPISTSTQIALNGKQSSLGFTPENTINKGETNGYASLGSDGKVPPTQLPSYVDDVLEATNFTTLPAIGETGKIYVTLDNNKTYRWSGSAYIYITSGAVDSVSGKTGIITLIKSDVGLSNVDNTSDSSKPVSTSQQTALNLKANLASPTFTGIVGGISKTMVGLPNVDNVSDTNKPISVDTQTALDGKVDNSQVLTNVPIGALFTDANTVTTINGKTGVIVKADVIALGIPAQDTVYVHPTGTNPHGTTKADVGLGGVVNSDTTTTSNIIDSLDKRFVTDSQESKIDGISGTNTGDETVTTIKTKLGITTFSGSNTGDQVIPTSLPANGGNADTIDGKHATDFPQLTNGGIYGIVPSTASTMVGNEYNILLNATKRSVTFTQSGTGQISNTSSLCDGILSPNYSTDGIDPADPLVLLISGLPSVHTQTGGVIGWTSRYWYPSKYKIEAYDTSDASETGWKTIVDQSVIDKPTKELLIPLYPVHSGVLTDLRITIYESTGSIGVNGFKRWGLSEIFFAHPEAIAVYQYLNVNSANKLSTTRAIALSGDATGTINFDGSVNVTIPVVIIDDSHNHIISNVDGLQTALDNKVDDSQVLTNVPSGALFTDTNTITSINGKTSIIAKADIVALGIPAQDTVYVHPLGTNPHGTTKSDVGLGLVDNTSDASKLVSTVQQTALNLKANLSSPSLTGIPTAPTATTGTNTTQLATTAFVQSTVTALGAGDMAKSVYDTNLNGMVDNSERVNGIKYTVSATAPAAPSTNDIWIDLN